MVQRNDPGRPGVKAGRVVGVLTAFPVAILILRDQEGFYDLARLLLASVGREADPLITALFVGQLVAAVLARYTFCYIVGSLIGVLYDWLDRPSSLVLVGVTLLIGVGDGFLVILYTPGLLLGGMFVASWLAYVPVFVWLFDEEAGDNRAGPIRLSEL